MIFYFGCQWYVVFVVFCIACFGLAFKANIDDLRESPSLEISLLLTEINAKKILLVEPNINEIPIAFAKINNVSQATPEEALKQADIILGLVNHKEFKDLEVKSLDNKTVIDTCGIWFD